MEIELLVAEVEFLVLCEHLSDEAEKYVDLSLLGFKLQFVIYLLLRVFGFEAGRVAAELRRFLLDELHLLTELVGLSLFGQLLKR